MRWLAGVWLLVLAAPALAQIEPAVESRPLAGLKADVAALILAGREGGALRAAVAAVPVTVAGDRASVALWVEIDGSSLLAGEPSESLEVEVYAYALTSAGAVKGYLSQWFRLDLEELGEVLFAGGVKFFGLLETAGLEAAGDVQLRVLVRERRSQRLSLRHVPLPLPGDAPVLLAPAFTDPPGTWIRARPAGLAPDGLAVPAAIPVLAAGREVTARLRGYGLRLDPPQGTLQGRVRLLDAERRNAGEADVIATSADGGADLEIRFVLPDLATGSYVLETSLKLGSGAEPVAPPVPVIVLGAAWGSVKVAWTGLEQLASRPADRPRSLDLAAGQLAAKRVQAIAEAYREVLHSLASGFEATLEELRKMEEEVFEASAAQARQLLGDAEAQVVDELVEHDVEILVPVLVLHMDLHDRYVRARRFPLAAHSRERVGDLARRYAAEAASELAPSLAGEALATMGAYLHRVQLRIPGRKMLEEALELDASNSFALLRLAAAHELADEYPEAISCLERLLEVEPRSAEGRLRLAIGLRRQERRSDAARLLRRLIDDGGGEWLLALAYQEMGRIYASQERFGAAVEVLEQGIVRLPAQRRLYLQLAYVLDRHGEGRRGHEVLDSAPAATEAWQSPRFRYNRRRSDDDRAAVRQSLRRTGMVRLPVLLEALDPEGTGP